MISSELFGARIGGAVDHSTSVSPSSAGTPNHGMLHSYHPPPPLPILPHFLGKAIHSTVRALKEADCMPALSTWQ